MAVRRRRTILVAALVLTGSACTASGVATRARPSVTPTITTPPPGVLLEIRARDGAVLREFEVGPDPLVAVEASERIWTLNLDDGSVSSVDPSTGEVRAPFDGNVAGIAGDATTVWGAVDGRWLVEIDGTTGETRRRLEVAEEPVFGVRDAGWPAVGGGSLWLTVPDGDDGSELWQVDPRDGLTLARIPIPSNPMPIVFLRGAIWITHEDGVLRVDARTLERRLVDVGPFPAGVPSLGRDGIWVPVSGGAVRLDPETGEVREELAFPASPRGLEVVGPHLWLTTDTGVTVVDRRGDVVRTIDLAEPSDDEGPIAIVRLGGSVWVTVETV